MATHIVGAAPGDVPQRLLLAVVHLLTRQKQIDAVHQFAVHIELQLA